jgi:hypothetical protein
VIVIERNEITPAVLGPDGTDYCSGFLENDLGEYAYHLKDSAEFFDIPRFCSVPYKKAYCFGHQ